MGIKSPMAEKEHPKWCRQNLAMSISLNSMDGENHHLLPCPMKPEGIYYVHKLREYPHIYI